MKKIIYNDKEFLSDNEEWKVALNNMNIFYIVGHVFDSSVKNLTRKMIEDESLKEYKEKVNKIILAKNEQSFLYDFFNNQLHYMIDIFNILSFSDLENIKNQSQEKNIIKNTNAFISFFYKEKSDYVILYNKINKTREYIKIIYDDEENKRLYLNSLISIDKEIVFTDSVDTILKMYEEALEMLEQKERNNFSLSYVNHLLYEDESIDSNAENTFNKITLYKYEKN